MFISFDQCSIICYHGMCQSYVLVKLLSFRSDSNADKLLLIFVGVFGAKRVLFCLLLEWKIFGRFTKVVEIYWRIEDRNVSNKRCLVECKRAIKSIKLYLNSVLTKWNKSTIIRSHTHTYTYK